jgi:hypothetical protein
VPGSLLLSWDIPGNVAQMTGAGGCPLMVVPQSGKWIYLCLVTGNIVSAFLNSFWFSWAFEGRALGRLLSG